MCIVCLRYRQVNISICEHFIPMRRIGYNMSSRKPLATVLGHICLPYKYTNCITVRSQGSCRLTAWHLNPMKRAHILIFSSVGIIFLHVCVPWIHWTMPTLIAGRLRAHATPCTYVWECVNARLLWTFLFNGKIYSGRCHKTFPESSSQEMVRFRFSVVI